MEEQEKADVKNKLVWLILFLIWTLFSFYCGDKNGQRRASCLWFDIGYRLCYKELKGEQPGLMPVFPGDR